VPEPDTLATVHIGLISDTHGLLRPAALKELHGVQLIIHAGDVGTPEILKELAAIAPVTAVRGNVDRGFWANRLPRTAVVEAGGARIYVLHDFEGLDLDPAAAGFAAVITGHTHRAALRERGGVLYFNPGSAGPRRFSLPITMGRLFVEGGKVRGELVALDE
jgi:uncharacterized protein